MEIRERNLAIKRLLEKAFGKGKVKTRGGRGTAYGWVHIDIAYAPRNRREDMELRPLVERLILTAGIQIGSFDSADYGSGREMIVNFLPTRETAATWGDYAWRHNLSAADWDRMHRQDSRGGAIGGLE